MDQPRGWAKMGRAAGLCQTLACICEQREVKALVHSGQWLLAETWVLPVGATLPPASSLGLIHMVVSELLLQ